MKLLYYISQVSAIYDIYKLTLGVCYNKGCTGGGIGRDH